MQVFNIDVLVKRIALEVSGDSPDSMSHTAVKGVMFPRFLWRSFRRMIWILFDPRSGRLSSEFLQGLHSVDVLHRKGEIATGWIRTTNLLSLSQAPLANWATMALYVHGEI